MLDRTAVLAVGLIAGFAVGLSFNAAGRRQAIGWLTGAAPVAVVAPPAPLAPAPAVDRDRPELAALLSPRVVDRVKVAGRITVGVFGDSYGDGVWAALSNQLRTRDRFEVLRFSKEATGFTRYRTLNLEDRARAQVAARPIDVAVISFGANDIQPIFEGGHLRALMSPDWQAIIGERIDRFVGVARSTGAAVFWVGLPVMRDGDLDASVEAMNAFYAAKMKALGVPYIETRSRSLDARGRYDAYLPDRDGTPRLMRTGDGIHMTIPGYIRLTAPLAERVRADAAQVWRRAGMPAPTPTPTPASTAAPAAVPSPIVPKPTPRPQPTPRSPAEIERLKTARANQREADRTAPVPAATEPPLPAPSPTATADAEHGKTAKANRREASREKKAAPAPAPSASAEP